MSVRQVVHGGRQRAQAFFAEARLLVQDVAPFQQLLPPRRGEQRFHLGLFHMPRTATILLVMLALVMLVDAGSLLARRALTR